MTQDNEHDDSVQVLEELSAAEVLERRISDAYSRNEVIVLDDTSDHEGSVPVKPNQPPKIDMSGYPALFGQYIALSSEYRMQGNLWECNKLIKKAVDLEEQVLKRAGHEGVRVTMVGLYRGLGQGTKSDIDKMSFYKKGLQYANMGPVYDAQFKEFLKLDVYDIEYGLSIQYINMDMLSAAEPLCRRVYTLGEEMYGNRPGCEEEYADSLLPLAFLYSKLGKVTEAANIYETQLKILQDAQKSTITRPYCASHTDWAPQIEKTEDDLLEVWMNGKIMLDRAEEFLRTSLSRPMGKKDEVRMATFNYHLSKILSYQEKYEEAEKYCYKATNIFDEYHDSFCRFKAFACQSLGDYRLKQDKVDAETQRLYETALKMLRSERSLSNVQDCLRSIGLMYYRQNNITQALVCYNEAKKICESCSGADECLSDCITKIEMIESGVPFQ